MLRIRIAQLQTLAGDRAEHELRERLVPLVESTALFRARGRCAEAVHERVRAAIAMGRDLGLCSRRDLARLALLTLAFDPQREADYWAWFDERMSGEGPDPSARLGQLWVASLFKLDDAGR